MATYSEATIQQGTAEIRKWTADFTDDLLSGVTVSSGTATHIPPSGSAGTVTITTTSTTVTAQLGPVTITGVHYLDILATFSNSEKSSVRIAFPVNYPAVTARPGMLEIIDTLRSMTDANVNEYTIAGVPYWSDAQLQTSLNRHRTDIQHIEAQPMEIWSGPGTLEYKVYHIGYANIESGTAFVLEDATGEDIGTASYSVDYARGVITFTTDQAGSARFVTANSYDLNAAAADVWRPKMGQAAKLYDFSTDKHNLRRSQFMAQCREMAQYYDGLAAPTVIQIYRADMITED